MGNDSILNLLIKLIELDSRMSTAAKSINESVQTIHSYGFDFEQDVKNFVKSMNEMQQHIHQIRIWIGDIINNRSDLDDVVISKLEDFENAVESSEMLMPQFEETATYVVGLTADNHYIN